MLVIWGPIIITVANATTIGTVVVFVSFDLNILVLIFITDVGPATNNDAIANTAITIGILGIGDY
jgi:hypothetical protein